jgi:hypothetical protein
VRTVVAIGGPALAGVFSLPEFLVTCGLGAGPVLRGGRSGARQSLLAVWLTSAARGSAAGCWNSGLTID